MSFLPIFCPYGTYLSLQGKFCRYFGAVNGLYSTWDLPKPCVLNLWFPCLFHILSDLMDLVWLGHPFCLYFVTSGRFVQAGDHVLPISDLVRDRLLFFNILIPPGHWLPPACCLAVF